MRAGLVPVEETPEQVEARRARLNRIAERAVGAAFEVSNVLGTGFLESVYERALAHELSRLGLHVVRQAPIAVSYKGEPIGEFYADLLVEDELIIELKCCDAFSDEHLAQVLNYLRATGKCLALLINFQRPKLIWRRIVHNF